MDEPAPTPPRPLPREPLNQGPLNQEQFMRLFLQAERELTRYVMAIVPNVNDARDVVQETAMSLWRAIAKYDPAKPFVPWACRFALNEARMHLRTEARRRKRFLQDDVVALLEERRQDLAPQLDARRQHLRDCLDRLPDDHRGIVRGYYFDDESVDVIAARLGRSVDAIYKSLQRIRQVLQECIERKTIAEARP